MKGIRNKGFYLGKGLFILGIILISFSFGRLFEIFSWNSNIIRIESISQKSISDYSNICNYSQLNDGYWEEKALEDSKIRIDFYKRYCYLNNKSELVLGDHQDKYLSYKSGIERRSLFRVIYSDNYLLL